MADATLVEPFLAAIPGLAALGVSLQNRGDFSVTGMPAVSSPEMPITVSQVREARDMWIKAVQSRSVEATVALYDTAENNGARLLGTVDTEGDINRNGRSAIEAYFKGFLNKDEIIANFPDVTDDSIIRLGQNHVIYSGYYTFFLTKDGLTTEAKAKFSYVYVRKPGVPHLLITTHNSGITPQGVKTYEKRTVGAGPSQAEMQAIATENFKRWNDSLQTKDNVKVAALYSPSELSFLPTVSPVHIKGPSDTQDYFKAFVQKNPFGTITDDSVQSYDNGNTYLHSGMYTFGLGPSDSRAAVQARFSYVWKKYADGWKITHHHSSVRPADAPSAAQMQEQARANFKKWNDSLQTKDNMKVAACYSTNQLSFLPTVSPKHITGAADTQDYFKAFVQKNPFGTITDDQVQTYNNGNTYLHSGMYTFELGDAGKRTPVSARFSYVWNKEGNDWKITHHHSSVCPQ
jgi:hypothetical protein